MIEPKRHAGWRFSRDSEQKHEAPTAPLLPYDRGRRARRQFKQPRPVEVYAGAIVHVPPYVNG
jgi:hypothetical protein